MKAELLRKKFFNFFVRNKIIDKDGLLKAFVCAACVYSWHPGYKVT